MFDENKSKISQDLVKCLNKCKDVFVFKDDDYREPLYAADAFICDRSSLAFEIAYLNKPTLFLENKDYREKYVEEFEELFNAYEKGYTFEDVDDFVTKVIKEEIKVSDDLPNALSRCINQIDGKAAERIVNDLYDSVVNEGK